MRAVLSSAALAAAILLGQAAMADTFVPGNTSVRYSTNVDGSFTVDSAGLDMYGATGWASAQNYGTIYGVQAGDGYTPGVGYADAGLVLYFNGSMTLGQLQNVNIALASSDPGNATPIVNLWLDTGGDNQFFVFSGTQLTGLAGDAYFGAATAGNINGGTTFGYLGGPGGYSAYTLSQLQQGARAGIDASTKVALWIGLTSPNTADSVNYVNITRVDVATVPLPSAAWGALALLGSLGVVAAVRRRKHT